MQYNHLKYTLNLSLGEKLNDVWWNVWVIIRRDHGKPFSMTVAKMGGIFTTFNQLDTNKKKAATFLLLKMDQLYGKWKAKTLLHEVV